MQLENDEPVKRSKLIMINRQNLLARSHNGNRFTLRNIDFHPLFKREVSLEIWSISYDKKDLDFSSQGWKGYCYHLHNSCVASHLCTCRLCRTVRSGTCMCNYPGCFRRRVIFQDNWIMMSSSIHWYLEIKRFRVIFLFIAEKAPPNRSFSGKTPNTKVCVTVSRML